MTPINEIPAVCNYGTSAVYSDYPNDEQLRRGVVPLDSLPAAWWNKMWCASNCAINEARDMVGQLITEINAVLAQAGICPTAACTDQLYQSINLIRQRLATASTPGAVVSSADASKVAVEADGTMSVNCLGNAASLTTSASTIVGAINELKSTYDTCLGNVSTALDGKAPTSHASSATTYGVGSASDYGHLKISDTYTSTLSACSGVAASQKALACVYAVAAAAAAGNVSLGNVAGCALGTASAGTALTAARSDHVHPKPSRTDLGLGTAADCAATDFRASTWTPTCVACAGKIKRNAFTNAYLFTVALTNGCSTTDGTDLYASCKCLLTFCSTTGVLSAACFCGTATRAGYATCLYNRPGSTEASKVCNAMFYAGCSNASCIATNYAVCICGANGYIYGNVCGNVCGTAACAAYATNSINSCKVYKNRVTGNADRQVLLGEASEAEGSGCVYVGNACKLTFNTSTGVLCTCTMMSCNLQASNYANARLMIMCCLHLRDSSGHNALSLFDPYQDSCTQSVSVATYCEHFAAGVDILHLKAAATCTAQRCVLTRCLIDAILCHTNKSQLLAGAICTIGCSMWTTLDQATRCGNYIYFYNCGTYCMIQLAVAMCFTTSDTCQLRCGGIGNLVIDMSLPL